MTKEEQKEMIELYVATMQETLNYKSGRIINKLVNLDNYTVEETNLCIETPLKIITQEEWIKEVGEKRAAEIVAEKHVMWEINFRKKFPGMNQIKKAKALYTPVKMA